MFTGITITVDGIAYNFEAHTLTTLNTLINDTLALNGVDVHVNVA